MKRIKQTPRYLVDEDGCVYSACRQPLVKLVPHRNTQGYLHVSAAIKRGETKTLTVHRLVAETFLPNPNNYQCVNHIDGNKLNNKVTNLEWCSHKANSQHASDNNLHGRGAGRGRSVIQFCYHSGEKIQEFASIMEAARHSESPRHAIKDNLQEKTRKTKNGYVWKYKSSS